MEQARTIRARRPFTRAAALLGLAATALGTTALLYRATDVPAVEHALGFALRGVRPATAFALIAAGVALAALHYTGRDRSVRALAVSTALGLAGLGALGLATAARGDEGLVSLPTAAALVLLGGATALAVRSPGPSRAVQLAAGGAGAIALLVILGHVYSARPFYVLGGLTPARLGSGIGLALLATALLLARPEYALSRLLAGRTLGAVHLRAQLPLLLAVPLATGVVSLAGLRAGWYGEAVAFALFTLLAMAALTLLGALSARRIDALARERAALEEMFQRTFDNASVGVARLDADGRWLHVNARLCEIVGWPREELIGRRYADVTHPEDRNWDEAMIAELARGERDSQHLEKRFVTKQGHAVWADAFVSAERRADGGVEWLVAMIQEIEARKRAERARDEFLALVSHELRSPLHVLGGWLAVLRHENAPEVRARALAIAERSAALLARLIGDLLDASRIASGKLEIEREVLDAQQLVRTVVSAFEPLAASRDVTLALELPDETPFVACDPDRIEQVVRNLVENALKVTGAGGRVTVRLARADGHARIEVADTGQGIAPDLLPRIFERLTQGEGGPRGAGRGLGLGLSIARHLVELHGGRIEAHSDGAGRGARFVVALPETAMPLRLAPRLHVPSIEESDALDGVRVLLVKPDRSAAEAVALALEAADASVAWVRSGEEALAHARTLRPRVVVGDLDAAPEAWAKWLAELRATGRGPLAAIALSAGDATTERRRARAAGFDAFVHRPADPHRVVATIHNVLSGPTRVLVVDDERDAADSLAILLARRGFEVERAYDVAQALDVAARFQPSAVLTDLELGVEDGAELARALRARSPRPLRIVAISGRPPGAAVEPGSPFDGFARKPVELPALLALLRNAS